MTAASNPVENFAQASVWQPFALALQWPRLTALLLGALAASGFPPVGLWPVTLVCFAGFVALLRKAETKRRAFMLGWLLGVAHFTVANNWIAGAFRYQDAMPVALGWLAVPLLSLYLAVYPALAAFGAFIFARRAGPAALTLAFTGCWIITEWLRSWVFTGYAWDPLGLVFLSEWDRPGLAAILPWTGTYALSGLVVLVAGGFYTLLLRQRWKAGALAATLLMIGMYLPAPGGQQGTLAFTLVQPDLRQENMGNPALYEEQFQKIAGLSLPREANDQRVVLWPESAVPDYLREGYPQRYYDASTVAGDPGFARWRIGRMIGEGGLLLTGATDLNIENDRAISATNSVTVLSSDGRIVDAYDKAHLVPYGEYLALRWLLEPLGATRLVAGAIDFIPGPGPRTLELGAWGRPGIQICYEIIFSGQVTDPDKRPDYIFNPSNDGWFGEWGPPQHMAQARLRAIEEGLPVLRSTTTGISAVIDANGVVRDHIGSHRAGRIDGFVPPAKPATPFARLGNILPLGWAFGLLLIAGMLRIRQGAGSREI